MSRISKTVEQVDEAVLEEAAKVLGTDTPGDTVNAALREVVRARAAGRYVEYLKERPDAPDAPREDAWR